MNTISHNALNTSQRKEPLVLGIEFSSQSVSWQVSHAECGPVASASFSFQTEIPDIAGRGWLNCLTGDVVTSPMLFVLGLDAVLKQISECDLFDIKNIACIAGSGQQHGQVFLKSVFKERMKTLDPKQCLREQISDCFARPFVTTWMNSSTSSECETFASYVPGGAKRIAELTGAIPTERFFGPSILRVARMESGYFEQSSHITLISAFGASLLLGAIAPLEQSDAAGGNLMNIATRKYADEILKGMEREARGVSEKLPPIVTSLSPIGNLSSYYVQRYGFSADCMLLPWTGDNGDSLLGKGVYSREQGIRVNSKGTSETEIAILGKGVHAHTAGAIFGAVTDALDGFQNFAIATFKNGTLALEKMLGLHELQGEFEKGMELIERVPAGNNGKFMLGFFEPEISPRTSSAHVSYHNGLEKEDTASCLRALVEFQAINRKIQTEWMQSPLSAYVATGGGGMNKTIAQIDADVHNVPVYISSQSNSVVNGACLRALHVLRPEEYRFEQLCSDVHCPKGEKIEPKSPEVYPALVEEVRKQLAAAIG